MRRETRAARRQRALSPGTHPAPAAGACTRGAHSPAGRGGLDSVPGRGIRRGGRSRKARSLTLKKGNRPRARKGRARSLCVRDRLGRREVGAGVVPGSCVGPRGFYRKPGPGEGPSWKRCCHRSWILIWIPSLSPHPAGLFMGWLPEPSGLEGLPLAEGTAPSPGTGREDGRRRRSSLAPRSNGEPELGQQSAQGPGLRPLC